MPPDADRVLVVGEALVDVVAGTAHPGGSPLNVAVGLARLGIPTLLHTRFGADGHGGLIAEHLQESGVHVTTSSVTADPTSVAEATIGADGSATYAFAVDWTPAALAVDPSPAAVHLGSFSALMEPGATTTEKIVRQLHDTATVSYDPNARPALMGTADEARPRIERLIALADVVKASDEDVAWLYPDAPLADVLQGWLALGPALAVVTRGGDGADALAASGAVHVDAPSTEVVDTIGAGDSFMAALLAALDDRDLLGGTRREALRAISGDELADVVRFAIRCAAITVSRPGADPPDRDDL